MTVLGFFYCNYFCQYRPEPFDYFHVEYATKFSCLLTLSEDDDYAYLKYFKKGFRSSITPNIVTLEGFEDFSEDPKRQSEVWKHFLLNKVLEKAKCKHCSEILSIVTTTLKNHLRMKHKIHVKSLRDERPKHFADPPEQQQSYSELQQHHQ